MVGLFSRFSVSKSSFRRTQSADEREEVLPSGTEATTTSAITAADSVSVSVTTHGIEIAFEFKPVEHPAEPLDNDQPVQCPFPEPSILNDGRIWKERVSSGVQTRADTPPVMQEQSSVEPENSGGKPPRHPRNRVILPSISAPEHNILKLLEECNASGI